METLKSIFLKQRPNLIAVVSIALIAIAVINIYFAVAVRVTSNDECLWVSKKVSKDSTAIFFDLVKVDGVTWNAGIRNGDQLLEIDNHVLQHEFHAQGILNEFTSGDYAEYKVIRDGKVFTTKVYIKKLIQFGFLAAALSALFWMIIGFVVLTAKPDGRIHRLFYFLGVLAVLSSLSSLLPIYGDFYKFFDKYGFIAIAIGYLLIIGICFAPFVLNYFFWNFPTPFKFVQKKWVKRLVFIVPTILSIVAITTATLVFNFVIDDMVFLGMIQLLAYFGFFANIPAWMALIVQYRRIKVKEKKKPILLMLIAVTFGLAVAVYAAQIAPAIADSFFNSPEYFAPIILIAIVPLVFAYAIFKYQLMDVSVVIRNTIVYGAATVTIAAIYFLVIYIAGQSISSFLGVENQGIIAGLFFIIFAIVFQSTKDKFQDFLTKRFYPEQFASQQVLIDLSNELAIVAGLDNILKLMKRTFVDALKIQTFGILVRDKEGNLSLVDSVGMQNTECKITESRISKFIKEKMLLTKHPAIEQSDFKDVFPDNKAERLLDEDVHTIIPMMIKGKIVGLLLFGLKHSGSCFTGKDIELLWAAANQAAISIENARLYKSEVEKQKIERDLDLARKIQEGLLPQNIPDMPGLDICGQMLPAMQVGGDYFDLIQVTESKLFVIVGDVSGKGLSASLYMTKLQTMIKLSCEDNKTPKEILVDVNKRIYEELDKSWFVTITLALFDLKDRKLNFCRAGHMPIILASNGTVQSYRTQGLGVGIEKGIIFEKSLVEEEVLLKPGQIFAFFTDGITEAMNEKSELFGDDKLNSILKHKSQSRSSDIVNEVWHSVETFRGTAEMNDDMTMVVVKVK
ncbi:MAG: SpoIIE family protein phosphatase [Ignavibacteria bacterium]|nr:SpoIIE family protein phosphatase [Ignavibacteria bacterium]